MIQRGITSMHIHVLPDNKFNESFIKYAKKVDVDNTFVCKVRDEPQYYHKDIIYTNSIEKIKSKINNLSHCKVYIHGLYGWRWNLLEQVNSNIPITWIYYGVDGYNIYPFKNLYESKTRKKVFGSTSYAYIEEVSSWIRLAYRKSKTIAKYYKIQNLLTSVDRMAFWLRKELDMIKNYYSIDANTVDFRYADINEPTKVRINQSRSIRRILLGNSANPTNNHLDALHYLDCKNDNVELVIAPLSYSGSENYVENVIKEGKEIFGSKFLPITEFMNKKKYLNMLESVDAGLFFHRRQQAAGTINYLLWSGIPVYLNPNSPFYEYLKQKDVKLALSVHEYSPVLKTDTNDHKGTTNIIQSMFDREKIISRYRALLKDW